MSTKKTAAEALKKKRTPDAECADGQCDAPVSVTKEDGDFGKLLATIGKVDEGKSSITVALYRIAEGPVRVAITRTFKTAKGETKHGKLGRLNGETAAELAPLLVEAANVARTRS